MLGGTVTLEYEGEPGARIAVITISSPEVRNALTPGMGRDLVALCDRIDADDQVISAVIRGANGTFCSGGDTREWTVISDAASDEAYRSTSAVYESFARFGRLSVPSIAAIRGAAVGAGLNIALAADLRICAEDARLIAGFGQIGIHPGGGFFALLGR